jgi:hypothetical protein
MVAPVRVLVWVVVVVVVVVVRDTKIERGEKGGKCYELTRNRIITRPKGNTFQSQLDQTRGSISTGTRDGGGLAHPAACPKESII